MTNRISAAENITIEMDTDYWRLLVHNELGERTEVLRAAPGQPLTFNADFALTRRLPSIGRLPAKYVRQVVLGWSHDDDAWHLGLLLARDIADIRGSRWCEVANWPDPDPIVFAELARQSGEALATLLDLPFNVISPRPEGQPRPRKSQPLPQLPVDLGTWRLENADEANELVFTRSRRWLLGRYGRIAWYGALSAIYVVLSITTLQNNLALPNSGIMLPSPELLPYLGIAAAVVSIGIVLYTLSELLTVPNRITVDGSTGTITALRGDTARWQKSATEIESVYVTHILKRRRHSAAIDHGEINFYCHDGHFDRLLEQAERDDEEIPYNTAEALQDGVMTLEPNDHLTDLQKAGLHLARVLGNKPVWYDQRER